MKWDLKSKRFLGLLIINLIWVMVGFVAHQWDVFGSMTIPVIGLNATYIAADTISKSITTETHDG